jgi:hypothetical protein
MIATFSLYVDFWCGVGFMHSKVAHDQPLVNMFMLWSVIEYTTEGLNGVDVRLRGRHPPVAEPCGALEHRLCGATVPDRDGTLNGPAFSSHALLQTHLQPTVRHLTTGSVCATVAP